MILLICLLLGTGAALVVVGFVQSRQPAGDAIDFLRTLDGGGSADEFEDALSEPFFSRVLRPAGGRALAALGRMTPLAQRDRVHHQLVLAGIEADVRAEQYLALQAIGTVLGALAGLALGASRGFDPMGIVLVLLAPAVGYVGPKNWLTRKVKQRQEALFLDMPDVLDLLAISVEAGMGFEGALEIVCKHFTSPLAMEFSRTLKEMELGLPRRDALQNLKKRTEVPELSNFVLALVQADALGMPIGRVLHTQAVEMRTKRRQWAREKAGKLPVKILFPLVAFIFPAVLIVVLGPAASSIAKSLR